MALAIFTEDVQAALAGLLQGFGHQFGRDAGDLDVHLQGGDAVFGTTDLEVHVAVVVFVAEDVGEDGVAIAFHDQTHGDTGNRGLDRHTGGHQRQRAAADGGHRRRAVRLEDVGDEADGVGPLFGRWQDLLHGALGQGAVADLAATWAWTTTTFADREAGEVVVQDKVVEVLGIQAVDHLLVFGGAQGTGDQALGLAASEQRRAVGARQHVQVDHDRTHGLGVATVDAHTLRGSHRGR